MICANTDDTERIISERQLRTLMQLGKNLADPGSTQDIIERTISTMGKNKHDFPFVLFYTLAGNKATLTHTTPLGQAASLIPAEIDAKMFASVEPTSLTVEVDAFCS